MIRLKSVFIVLAVALAAGIASCEKEGPAGPAGPQGEQGAAGPKGDKGDTGAKGVTGNANVRVFTKDISNAQWAQSGNAANGYLYLDISAPKVLTADVVNNWVNLVYVYTSDAGSNWAQLPYYSERNIRVSATISVGKLTLKRDQDGQPSTQSWFHNVKLVCIKPSSTGPLARQKAPLPDFSDYRAVCDYYGIAE